MKKKFQAVSLLAIMGGVWACSSLQKNAATEGERASESRDPAAAGRELPWEVRGDHGETLLPNIYYSEASENQQVMPLTVGGSRFQIDRLVYPTIGNPSLIVRSDESSRIVLVMRIEPELYAHLNPTEADEVPAGVSSELQAQLKFDNQNGQNGFAFYLMNRANRVQTEYSSHVVTPNEGSYRVLPSMILVDRVSPNMPEAFKKRRTLRIYFEKSAFAHVREGFYDTRFEMVKDGKIQRNPQGKPTYEYQYNAVRIFDKGPEATADSYTILNVTDSQVSVGTKFQALTLQKFKDFVGYVKRTYQSGADQNVKSAAFITFNGDLHNGGSPFSVASLTVAKTYNDEAREILAQLKELPIPIFLTVGNHDGYASTGVVPKPVDDDEHRRSAVGLDRRPPLDEVIPQELAGNPTTVENFKLEEYMQFLKDMRKTPGGKHVNLVSGTHIRRIPSEDLSGAGGATSWLDRAWKVGWKPVKREDRNFVLYDAVNQWQKTYGPTYFSWVFGKTHYLSVNTFELRQHRRTGWGMYTVNYGGWVTPVQLAWIDGELDRAQANNRDIVIQAHHDPRGGHNGKDYPYYFRQVEFEGMGQSFSNYVNGEIIEKKLCDKAPAWAKSNELQLNCMHDGLQEWMRPEVDFDCRPDERIAGDEQGRCDVTKFKLGEPGGHNSWYSGYAFLARIAGQNRGKLTNHPNLRTIIFGHTHYNSYEMKMEGDELVPKTLTLDNEVKDRINRTEAANPIRALSDLRAQGSSEASGIDQLATELKDSGIQKTNVNFVMDLEKAGHNFERVLQGTGEPNTKRELAILRTTSVADLTSQKRNGKAMNGFQVFKIYPKSDSRGYGLPQINTVFYYQDMGNGAYGLAGKQLQLDREKPMSAFDAANPMKQRFQGP